MCRCSQKGFPKKVKAIHSSILRGKLGGKPRKILLSLSLFTSQELTPSKQMMWQQFCSFTTSWFMKRNVPFVASYFAFCCLVLSSYRPISSSDFFTSFHFWPHFLQRCFEGEWLKKKIIECENTQQRVFAIVSPWRPYVNSLILKSIPKAF